MQPFDAYNSWTQIPYLLEYFKTLDWNEKEVQSMDAKVRRRIREHRGLEPIGIHPYEYLPHAWIDVINKISRKFSKAARVKTEKAFRYAYQKSPMSVKGPNFVSMEGVKSIYDWEKKEKDLIVECRSKIRLQEVYRLLP